MKDWEVPPEGCQVDWQNPYKLKSEISKVGLTKLKGSKGLVYSNSPKYQITIKPYIRQS
jgi:hypothetical protein